MKKIFLYFSIIATAVACTSESLEKDVTPMVTETISGTYGLSTKATIADTDASFKWSVGDNIAVHVSNGDSHIYVSTSGEGGASTAASSASFIVTYESGFSRDAFAVYPSTIVSANAANYGQSGSPLDVTLPSSYTLSQVQGEVSPCPMVAINSASSFNWDFYQLCSLLRITVGNIPATAKRLEIDFDGKKVWGDFSIASGIVPGTSVIATTADADHDIISITKDGTDAVLGETSLALNIPLPVGTYSKITVNAYDAVSGGDVLSFGNISFSYEAANTKGVKKSTSLTDQSRFTFTFRDADTQTNLGGLRFVRLFSCQNKLYNSATTFGPNTVSSATGAVDMANPVVANLKFASDDGDQLAFQVIDANGKVYSGLYDAPTGGFPMGSYDLTVDVKAYTFTVASGKKVYFSPGDLGVDRGVYSFTEPFEKWGGEGAQDAAKRVYFEGSEARPDKELYGVTWRLQTWPNPTNNKNEWENLIARTMNQGVNPYYKVQVGSNKYCVLLPPDETLASDIGDDLTTQVTDYVKYIAKGFVILMNTNYKSTSWQTGDRGKQGGYYWTNRPASPADRTLFYWTNSSLPTTINASSAYHCLHVRYVRDVE